MQNYLISRSQTSASGSFEPPSQEAKPDILWVDLNQVVDEVLEGARADLQKIHAIIRCDVLPHVKGEKVHFLDLFQELFGIVFRNAPEDSSLFIYLKCEPADQKPYLLQPDTEINFQLRLQTNIVQNEEWEQQHGTELAKCGLICSAHGGNFRYHRINDTSCLFTVNLPGKVKKDAI